jgi:hypothetical protein
VAGTIGQVSGGPVVGQAFVAARILATGCLAHKTRLVKELGTPQQPPLLATNGPHHRRICAGGTSARRTNRGAQHRSPRGTTRRRSMPQGCRQPIPKPRQRTLGPARHGRAQRRSARGTPASHWPVASIGSVEMGCISVRHLPIFGKRTRATAGQGMRDVESCGGGVGAAAHGLAKSYAAASFSALPRAVAKVSATSGRGIDRGTAAGAASGRSSQTVAVQKVV